MRFFRCLIQAYLYLRYHFHQLTQTGAFGSKGAKFIDNFDTINGHALKKALFKYYIKQFHESSCSVASVVTVINAIRSTQKRAFIPITQMEILEKVRTAHWKERMGPNGYHGRRGLPLSLLEKVMADSFAVYQVNYRKLMAVQMKKNSRRTSYLKKELLDRLITFEKQGRSVIVAHFDQGVYLKSENIPHISPIGGFDQSSGLVTILDVDHFQPNPYQIDFDTFYSGLASDYHHVFRPFGYNSGGYIWIQL
jgi:hypothetical protein